ncbi:MAG: helix-turn-helix domain-containing protein, partial [Patescibacteria group bacterium]
MSDPIIFDGIKYLSANDAAVEASLTRDYITRLCKEGRLLGKRIGRQWYISKASLGSFILEQSFDREKRRGILAESRKRTYGSEAQIPVAASDPSSRSRHVHDALRSAMARVPINSASHTARVITSVPINAISFVKHGSIPAVSPFVDAVHKIFAGFIALLFIVGTYTFVDAEYARIAKRPAIFGEVLRSAMTHQFAAVSENPTVAFSNIFATLARTLNHRVDSFVYGTMFPFRIAETSRASSVAVRVISGNTRLSKEKARDTLSTNRTVIERVYTQPIQRVYTEPVERVTEVQRIVSAAGGITEEYLTARLNQLDSKLSSQIYSASAQSSVNTTQIVNNYNGVAGALRIDELHDKDFNNSRWSGGTIKNTVISGSAVSATTLSSSGATSLATTTVNGDLTVTGSLTGGSVSFGATTLTGLTVTNSTTTNSTSTNMYSSSLIAGNATTTNLYISDNANFAGLASFARASTTFFSIFDTLYVGGSATTTIQGETTGTSTLRGFLNVAGTNSTSTFSGALATTYLNLTGSNATSTAANGFNIAAGCFAKSGSCLQFTDVVGILGIAQGGTATSTQVTNGVNYFDGT